MTFDQDVLHEALQLSRVSAFERAGKENLAVKDVANVQRAELRELLYGKAKGTEGAAVTGPMELPSEAETVIDEEAKEREKMLGDAEDTTVFERKDTVAASEDDATRHITVGHDALYDLVELERRMAHERTHTQQETGHQVAQILETGVPEIDAQKGIMERVTFRENEAMDEEKKVVDKDDHVPEYKQFQVISKAMAKYITSVGGNGDELVKAAAQTKEGFRNLQQAMIMATVRKEIEQAQKHVPMIGA